MTVIHERPQMALEDFEQLAHRAPETVTLEFLFGRIGVKPVSDGDDGQIVMWLIRQCLQQRPDLNLDPEQGLRAEGPVARAGRGRLAPSRLNEHFLGQGEWADPGGVLMAVDVTSYDEHADRRVRREKPRAYAESGRYSDIHTAGLGSTAELPGLGITLDTEVLENYVR